MTASQPHPLDPEKLSAIKERLRAGQLTDEDKSVLEDVLTEAEKLGRMESGAREKEGGLKVLASLPFGVDIVK
jgi:hypothetical protein